MNKFIFHSGRVPFGAVHRETINLALGGTVPLAGKTILSSVIPVTSSGVSPRIVYTVPNNTWYDQVGPQIESGTRLMSGSIRYIVASGTNGREVLVRPFVRYVAGGMIVGVNMSLMYYGTTPTSVTLPSMNLKMDVSVDVIPQNVN